MVYPSQWADNPLESMVIKGLKVVRDHPLWNSFMYTIEQKMKGEDLHGLPCRVPKPTEAQSKCDHCVEENVDYGYEDWDGEWQSDCRTIRVSVCEDVPGTNNFRCRRCGYTRRY